MRGKSGMKRHVILIALSLSGLLLAGCKRHSQEPTVSPAPAAEVCVDLPELQQQGVLRAVTLYSSTSYFQYKMQPMGYEYELIKDFARETGLKLEMKVAQSTKQLIEMLEKGEADVVAYPIPQNNQLKQRFIYCGHADISSQVLVQRVNKGEKPLKDVTELIGKKVYVKPGTKYSERLKNLNVELGGGIQIEWIQSDSITTEDLIEKVSTGEIPYTISDDDIARLNKTYYWNLNVALKVSFRQRSSWIVRNNSRLLANAIEAWASDKAGKRIYKAAVKRYFELSKEPMYAKIPPLKNGHISPYDGLFKKYARNTQWDWRLLASIAYQESRFDPRQVSWAGAEGLMGIMPNTAKALGVTPHELKNPEMGIRTGIDCLDRFYKGFGKVTDPNEKLKFTLASYNAGIGHIYDAQRLAMKYGKNPYLWENNVAEYVRLKSDPEFYNDSVCKHGYLRGSETYMYVEEVLQRYHYYKEKTR